jgi:anti-sigma B factor antagonist
MDEDRRAVLTGLHELSLEAAVDRLLDLGVLDAATLTTRKHEQLRDWRDWTLGRLGDELEGLRRQARQQRRHAEAQIAETRRQRRLAGATRATIVELDEHRRQAALRRRLARSELGESAAGLDAAHRALGAALAALALLTEREAQYTTSVGADLQVASERRDGRLILRLEGEIDISTAPRLNEVLADATASGADEVWVDLVGVRFIDSTGIAALLRATHSLAGPRRLAVICPDGPARRALELCGLGRLLPLHAERPAG